MEPEDALDPTGYPFPPKQSPPVVADDPAEPPAWNPIEEGFKPLSEKE